MSGLMVTRRRVVGGAALGLAAVRSARADALSDYPDRSIRLVVPYAPGSNTDLTAREVSPPMGKRLGQSIIVDNRSGATGAIGAGIVAKATPDGYTLVLGSVASHGTLAALMPDLSYNIQRDFTPIGLVTNAPAFIAVNPSVPAHNIKELVEYTKTLPEGLNYASSGVGGSGHLATELLRLKTGAKLVHVPYRDVSQAIVNVVAGEPRMIIYFASLLPYIRSGQLRAIAVLSEKRVPYAPDIPTAVEQGFPDYVVSGWGGLFGPAGLPDPIRDKLNTALNETLNQPELKARLTEQGQDPAPDTPAEFKAFVAAEIARWAEVVRAANIKLD
jgi:tripartite-type tricarboxylate transporter receptor subunit TctC